MQSFYCYITVIYLYGCAEETHVINRRYLQSSITSGGVNFYYLKKKLPMKFELKYLRHKVRCSSTYLKFLSTQSFACLIPSVL